MWRQIYTCMYPCTLNYAPIKREAKCLGTLPWAVHQTGRHLSVSQLQANDTTHMGLRSVGLSEVLSILYIIQLIYTSLSASRPTCLGTFPWAVHQTGWHLSASRLNDNNTHGPQVSGSKWGPKHNCIIQSIITSLSQSSKCKQHKIT